jgi:predicted metal-dependent hydrolase
MSTLAAEKSYQNRPKAIGITVRCLQFNPQAIRRHYFTNSPVMSHLLTALSSTFPIGEQFFVYSVRNVRDKVQDEPCKRKSQHLLDKKPCIPKHTLSLMRLGAVRIII